MRTIVLHIFMVLLLSLLSVPALASASLLSDTTGSDTTHHTMVSSDTLEQTTPLTHRVVAPALLIGLGLVHLSDAGVFRGNTEVRYAVQRHFSDFNTSVDDRTRSVPIVMAAGLNLAGVRGKHHFTEQAVLFSLTYLLNNTLTKSLKSATSFERPDTKSPDAFPSFHTSSAFANATVLHKEYGSQSTWYSIAGYSFAIATGAMRILNDRHWLSDVLVGAGIGILSAEVVYLVYPIIKNKVAGLFKPDRPVTVMPYYVQNSGGITIVLQL